MVAFIVIIIIIEPDEWTNAHQSVSVDETGVYEMHQKAAERV